MPNLDVILTGSFTLAAGLGGVWLTQRHTAAEARRTRAEARRVEQRALISEVLTVGRAKLDAALLILPAIGSFTQKDHHEFMDTDSGKGMRESNERFIRALVTANLQVGDPGLLSAIAKVKALNDDFASKVMGPALWKDGPGWQAGMPHALALGAALDDLEFEAAALMRVPVALPDPALVRAWRWVRERGRLRRAARWPGRQLNRLYRWWFAMDPKPRR
ncbi:hypothetical protein [Amycolatopsis sp. NPDC006125]|uniref:hypothetical protein n=1 Tax=Amycolatopsis sp. NPDC006125 TaxID=3156730 RepID=UPI0033BA0AE8